MLVTLAFWIAVALGIASGLAALSDVWHRRSDAAGRGLAQAYAVLILPFPILALALFAMSRFAARPARAGAVSGWLVAGAVVAALPLFAAAALSAARLVSERLGAARESAAGIFRGPARTMAEAIEDGRLDKVRGLCAQGVDVNAAGRNGETLLWFALRKGGADAAVLLVERGADPRRGPAGEPSAFAKAAGDPAFVEVLRAMLKAGLDPNATDPVLDVPTPLVFLAMNTNARPNIRAVVQAGANLAVTDTNGRTPLARAIVWRMWDEALLMLEHGAPASAGQPGLANLERTLADVVAPEPGAADHEAWRRLLAACAERGLPVPNAG